MRVSTIVVAGLLPLCGIAFSQPALQCAATAPAPAIARAEGLNELVGDLVLNCTGGAPTPAGSAVPTANISVVLNTAATSRLISGQQSEALLLIDDPLPGSQLACTSPAGCTAVGGTPGPNIFTGAQTGPNTFTWLGVPLDPPGSGPDRRLRITNLRANANQLGYNGAPNQVLATVSGSSLNISNPQQTLATVQPGLSIAVLPASFQYCPGFNNGMVFSAPAPGVANPATFNLLFTEQFPFAFKPQGVANQSTPGVVYNTESGFTSAALPASVGLADTGTLLQAVFPNIPSGLQLLVLQRNNLTDSSGTVAGTAITSATGGVLAGSYVEFTPDSTGKVTVTFQVTARDPTKTGPVSLNALITVQGALASGFAHMSSLLGFANSPYTPSTLFAQMPSIPGFSFLEGLLNPSTLVSQIAASVVPCANSGTNLNAIGGSAVSFVGVTPADPATSVNSMLISPRLVNVGLVSTLLPAGSIAVTKDPSATWLNVSLNQNSTPATATLSVNPAPVGNYSTTLQFFSPGGGSVLVPVTYTVGPAPWFSRYGFQSQASYVSNAVTPGEPFVIIGGNGFGPGVIAPPQLGSDGRALTTLGNTQVLFDGQPAPLYYSLNNSGKGQVAGFAPFGLDGKTQTNVQVIYNGAISPPVTLPVLNAVPGLYTADSSGGGLGSILNQNQTVNGPGNPEAPGNIVVLYGAGSGQTSPGGRDGALAGAGAPVATLTLPVKVFIDGIQATDISYSGPAPGIVEGVFQIDVRMPAGVRHNANVPVLVQIGNQQSQPGVTISTK